MVLRNLVALNQAICLLNNEIKNHTRINYCQVSNLAIRLNAQQYGEELSRASERLVEFVLSQACWQLDVDIHDCQWAKDFVREKIQACAKQSAMQLAGTVSFANVLKGCEISVDVCTVEY